MNIELIANEYRDLTNLGINRPLTTIGNQTRKSVGLSLRSENAAFMFQTNARAHGLRVNSPHLLRSQLRPHALTRVE